MKTEYKQFKSVTYSQISDMKHTIGFDNRKITGTKYRKYIPYRNYYDSGYQRKQSLDELVEIYFMKVREYHHGEKVGYVYHVTYDGREFLRLVTGVEILPEAN